MGMDRSKPLAGIRVVEMTTYLAAPSCGRTLAHLGAEVIKVEAPGGDPWRRIGGIYQIPHDDEVNPLFVLGNSGKRFITLDLKTEEGRGIMDRLLSTADIFITNMMNKTLKKLHITYEELHEKYPKLVYGRVIGYGEKGAEAERPGFDASAYLARGSVACALIHSFMTVSKTLRITPQRFPFLLCTFEIPFRLSVSTHT